jgi:rRNA-processing protein FCF1
MILLDANALMMPVECDVRVFEELDRLVEGVERGDDGSLALGVPRAVVAELERLAEGAGEEATAASVGLDLARGRCRVLDHEADHGDAAVRECARRESVTHAVTNDAALKRELLARGVPVISLRAGNKLAVTQP